MELADILKGAADYLNFVVEFATAPGRSLRDYMAKGKIDATLVGYFLAGVGVALVVAFVGAASGLYDPGRLAIFGLSFSGSEALGHIVLAEAMILVATFFVALVFHCLARAWIYFETLANKKPLSTREVKFRSALGGSIQDTLNASFAFAAFFLPSVTLLLLLATGLHGAFPGAGAEVTIVVLTTLLTILGVGFYFPAALSGTHPNTPFWQALMAFFGAFIIVFQSCNIFINYIAMQRNRWPLW